MDTAMGLVGAQGFVTTRAAAARGVTCSELNRLVAVGELEAGVRSVYLEPGERSPEHRLRLLSRAILSDHPGWVASHHSALSLFDIPLWQVPFDQVHVAGAQRNSVGGISVFRHVLHEGDEIVERHGVSTLAPALACLQVAARFGVPAGVVATDACLRAGLVTKEDLAAIVDAGRIGKGVAAARATIKLSDGRAESMPESLVRLTLGPLDEPLVPQMNVGGAGAGYRVDLLAGDCVVVEYDGRDKYGGEDGHQRVLNEKAREDYIRGLGYGFVRVTWEQLSYPATVCLIVAREIARVRAQAA